MHLQHHHPSPDGITHPELLRGATTECQPQHSTATPTARCPNSLLSCLATQALLICWFDKIRRTGTTNKQVMQEFDVHFQLLEKYSCKPLTSCDLHHFILTESQGMHGIGKLQQQAQRVAVISRGEFLQIHGGTKRPAAFSSR